MSSQAWWAYGSAFKIGSIAVAEIKDISGPRMTHDTIEVTHNDGTAGDGYRQFIGGWRDGGEVSVEANWLPKVASQGDSTGILAKFNADTLQEYNIVTPVATITFDGIVTAFECDLPMEEQGKLSFTIKISGAVNIS